MFTVCKRRKLMLLLLHGKDNGPKIHIFLVRTASTNVSTTEWTLWTVTCSRFSFRCIYPIAFNKINNGSMRWTTDGSHRKCIVSVEKFKRTNSTNDDFIRGKMKKTPNRVRTSHTHTQSSARTRKKITNLLTDIYSIPAHSQEWIWNAFNPSNRVAWRRIDESVQHFDHFLYCGME